MEKDSLGYEMEKQIADTAREVGREIYKNILLETEEWLYQNRDKKIFQVKTYTKSTLKTLLGPIELKRRLYQMRLPLADTKSVYLLDEVVYGENKKVGCFSVAAAEEIARMRDSEGLSFKQISEQVKTKLNLNITCLLYTSRCV